MIKTLSKKKLDILEYLLWIGIIVFGNIIVSQVILRLDLTEDKRYSLSPTTKDALGNLHNGVFVEVYLDGELNPSYSRLKKAIKENLEELKVYAGNKIEYKFFDPNSIEDKRLREQFYMQLVQKGVKYQYDFVEEGGKKEEKIVFPSAIVSNGEKEVAIQFLKGSKILPIEQQLNQAVEGIEYELMSGLRKLESNVDKTVAFVEGHGELGADQVADISSTLSEYYNVERVSLSTTADLNNYKALIIAKPDSAFSEQEKFKLDQYIINGGNALFLIDAVNLNHDSLITGKSFSFPYALNIDDMLFRYGVRLNPELVQDLNAALIKVETGAGGQFEMVNWPYFPILYNFGKHPTVKNLDAIKANYLGTIDTVKAPGILKTPLIFTTANTKLITVPTEINLNDVRQNVSPQAYNKGQFSVAYLLEGKFTSLFRNRPSPIPGLNVIDAKNDAKIIVFSDGDIIRNEYDKKKNKPLPLGYDPEIKYEFSNKDFILNAVDYLMDEKIINIRSKEILLRPLDKIKVSEERTQWQIINLVLPIIILILFGIGRGYWRKRKFEGFNK